MRTTPLRKFVPPSSVAAGSRSYKAATRSFAGSDAILRRQRHDPSQVATRSFVGAASSRDLDFEAKKGGYEFKKWCTTISAWERGRRQLPPGLAQQIATVLNIRAEYLL